MKRGIAIGILCILFPLTLTGCGKVSSTTGAKETVKSYIANTSSRNWSHTTGYLVGEALAIDIQTESGATATSGNSINLVISAISSNLPLTYSINGGSYLAFPSDGIVSASVKKSGPNNLQVSVKDNKGNIATKSVTVWKLP